MDATADDLEVAILCPGEVHGASPERGMPAAGRRSSRRLRRRPIRRIWLAAMMALPFSAVVHAEDARAMAIRDLIASTYGFKPSRLDASEQAVRAKKMDAFWNAVKGDPGVALPVLREALAAPAADPYFVFDGCNLLLTLDASPAAKKFQISCYARTDLQEIDLRSWVMTLARLATEGYDTSAAAESWLKDPGNRYVVPEHAFEADFQAGALFLYGSMDEAFATPALARIVGDAKHPGRLAAFQVLLSQATPMAIGIIRALAPATLPEKAREALAGMFTSPPILVPRDPPRMARKEFLDAFRAIVDHDSWDAFARVKTSDPDGEVDAVAVLKPEDLPLVRQVRRLRIARGHQHALEDFDSFTLILITLSWIKEWTR